MDEIKNLKLEGIECQTMIEINMRARSKGDKFKSNKINQPTRNKKHSQKP